MASPLITRVEWSTVKNELTTPPPISRSFWSKPEGVVSPAFQKKGILFNIEKGFGPNVLLTRGEVSRGELVRFCR